MISDKRNLLTRHRWFAVRMYSTCMAFKAWRREERKHAMPTQKPLVSFADLQSIIAEHGSCIGEPSWPRVLLAIAIFGFHALARLGELIPPKGERPPHWSDISVSSADGMVTLFLMRSKTDISKSGAPISVSADVFLTVCQLLGNPRRVGPIFTLHGVSPSRNRFTKWLGKAHVSIGPTIRGEAGHSLRRGGAQFLWNNGLPLDVIQVKGRWRSSAWQRYINLNARGTVKPLPPTYGQRRSVP